MSHWMLQLDPPETKRPDPDYNLRYLRYERRVFTCPACGQQTERIVEVAG